MSYSSSLPAIKGIGKQKYQKLSLWKRIKYCFLNRLSNRMKRLIFLSSFFGYTKPVDTLSTETMVKLNTVLALAHNVDAIEFPVVIRTWLWNHEIDDGIVIEDRCILLTEFYKQSFTFSDFSRIADFLMSKAPDWMVYGTRDIIAQDLQNLHLCNQS